jgi:hypothetical protein
MGDRRVDEMNPPTQRDPAKQPDLAKSERLRIKTGMLVLRIVSSSDLP